MDFVWEGAVSIRVAIVGDVRLYCEGIALHLAGDARFMVVGAAATEGDARRIVDELHPAVVLIDTAMRGSLALLRELSSASLRTHTVALTLPEGDEAALLCAEAGASGYVSRDASLATLTDVLQRVSRGECTLPPQAVAKLVRRLPSLVPADRPAPQAAALTAREREILGLIDDGCSNKEIASRLGIEVATAKNHVHHILEKLQVKRRGEAVARVRHSDTRRDDGQAMLRRTAFIQ